MLLLSSDGITFAFQEVRRKWNRRLPSSNSDFACLVRHSTHLLVIVALLLA